MAEMSIKGIMDSIAKYPLLALATFIGLQIALAMITLTVKNAGAVTYLPTGLQTRAVAAPAAPRPVVPVVNPQAAKAAPQAPKLVPVAQKKTQPEPVKPTPVLETKSAPTLETKSLVTAPAPSASAAPKSLDSTYEAYRNAMLSTGPRAQMEAARSVESKLETKSGNLPSNWRTNAQSLKLGEVDTAEFLSRTNVSVNDRMVAIFDAVKA